MFQARDPKKKPMDPRTEESVTGKAEPSDDMAHRHSTLMTILHGEQDLQQEERVQMAIDEDYHDHLQWDSDDAQVLMSRGQPPLVFNEGRLSVDWVTGTEKKNRIDYKILPREKGDQQGAETLTEVIKYTDDVNLTRYHRSFAFRQAVVSGLGYLEEGVNTEPDQEIIFAGSVDWKHVIRDSRSRDPDYNRDGRYIFRRRRLDLDYALALMPWAKDRLASEASTQDQDEDMDVLSSDWYMGQRLTAAHDQQFQLSLPAGMQGRGGFIAAHVLDTGRPSSIELIECWYKVPERVQVFADGDFAGKIVNERDSHHSMEKARGIPVYDSVAWRMRVMICTEDAPLWDGPSPFLHQKFPLVPVYGYRRSRDGMCYGVWRGMRDPQMDLNKRMSKALWAASANRVIADKGAVDDVDAAREEIARPDAWIEKAPGKELREMENTADVQFALQMAQHDQQFIRNVSGVTNENLGHDTNAISGKAILAKQSQGSTTTADLFENLRLSVQLAGQLRIANIKQFMTAKKVIRLTGEARPVDWLTINEYDPATGEYVNDITQTQADFIVAEQDWRANLQAAAQESFMELMKVIAPTAPQMAVAILDLLVDTFEIKGRDEIVRRIREINGQRDPSKQPTPDEIAAKQKMAAEADQQKKLAMDRLQAEIDKIRADAARLDASKVETLTQSLYQALQAAQIVATVPGVAPVADEIAKGAGFQDAGGVDPNIPAPAMPQMQPMPPQEQPMAPPPELQQADGAMQGIETPANDGVMPPV